MPEPSIRDIPIGLIFGNPDQPRKQFALGPLEDLAASIRENGLIQPIKVTARAGRFMVVAGERRLRAHHIAGLTTVRCIVEETMSDLDVLVEAIVENNMRVDIHPLEEAVAYQRCLDAGMTPDTLATKLGLQQAWRVTERTCLLNLRPEYQTLMRSGNIGRSQGYEMAQLGGPGQDQLFGAIRRGECSTYDALRSAARVIADAANQSSFFDDRGPTDTQRAMARGLERRFAQVATVLRASTVDNEIVAVRKVDPGRADTLADLLRAMQGDLRRIETALRASTQPMLEAA